RRVYSAARNRLPRLCGEALGADQRQDLRRGERDVGARAVDRGDPGGFEKLVILRRDDAAADDDHVAGALRPQRRDQRRHQRLVRRRLARHADDVDVVLDRLARRLLRGLEQRADIDVEAVLAELDHQHARAPPFLAGEAVDLALDAAELLVVAVLAAIDAADRAGGGAVAGEHGFEGIGNLADRRQRPASRNWRTRASRSIWALRTASLSTSRMSTGAASPERYLLTPTITSSPR